MSKLKKEYEQLETQLSSQINSDSNLLNEIKQAKDRELSNQTFMSMHSSQSITILEKDLELAQEKSKNAELKADSLMK